MNCVFRIIWSRAQRAWVVVSELTSRLGKSGGVDKRAVVPARVFDRQRVAGSSPAGAWRLRMGIGVALLSVQMSALAADRHWDPNGIAPGHGGNGNWNTAGSFWSDNSDGVRGPYSAWDNAALDDAFFGSNIAGGANFTVTLEEPITVHDVNFLTTGYVLDGSTLTLGGDTPTITVAPDVTATIDSAIVGSAGVDRIEISAGGTLRASGDLGDGDDVVEVAGTLDTGAGTFLDLGDGDDRLVLRDGAEIAGGGVDAGDGLYDTLTLDNADAFTFDGSQTAGFERLVKENEGTATLTDSQRFDRSVTIDNGTLDVDGDLDTSEVVLEDDTVLNVDGSLEAGGLGTAGSDGVNTVRIGAGGTLRTNGGGDLYGGDDVLEVAGTLATGTGTFLNLGDGDDELVLRDGAELVGGGVNAGDDASVDFLILDSADALTFDGSQTIGFERLSKYNDGTATLTGSQHFDNVVTIEEGELDVDGSLETPQVVLQDGTVLTVDGTLEADGGTATEITGTDGGNTIEIGAGGTLRATGDLGDNYDVLEVAGTLDTGAGTFLNLGDGDDDLILRDGAELAGGGVDAGDAGTFNDDFLYLSNADALTFDGSQTAGFERLIKEKEGTATMTGSQRFDEQVVIEEGELDVDGDLKTPQVVLEDDTVLNVDGTLEADGGTAAEITGSAGVNTIKVGAEGTLRANGDLGDGHDRLEVAGTLDTGAGTFLNLGAGNDELVLRDGAELIGGGVDAGDDASVDFLFLDSADALTFDGSQTAGFEWLVKQNEGTATLTGSQRFERGISIDNGELGVDGDLETPNVYLGDDVTLNVDGTLEAGDGTTTRFYNDDIDESATVRVGVGGTLRAVGSLDNGNDVLEVAGTLDTGTGVLSLGQGDDTFIVHDGAAVTGTVDGGDDNDTLNTEIDTVAELGPLVNFERLAKTGTGVLNLNGSTPTALQQVSVREGTLNVGPDASVVALAGGALDTVVASGATLHVDGNYGCSEGNDHMTVAGTVNGSGTIDLCGGDDTLTLQDGAVLDNTISGGAHGTGDTVVLDTTEALTFDAANTINFEYLQKDNAGEATLTGTQSFTGGTTVNGGTLTVAGQLQTPTVALADDTILNVDGRLEAGGGTAAEITGGEGANTIRIGADGTLRASGELGGSQDVLDVAGTLDTGAGRLHLGAGDDLLVLRDGAELAGSGVEAGEGFRDVLGLDNANALTFDGSRTGGFELLIKENEGTATLTGSQGFDHGVQLNNGELEVDGQLQTPTVTLADDTVLTVDGSLEAGGGTPAAITGSAGANTVTVGQGGTLLATGELGAGNDVLEIAGTLDTAGGTLALGAGDDRFTSSGTVRGALAFGEGDDAADFTGGDITGLTALEGGSGTDRLGFHGLDLSEASLPGLTAWERVELLDGSSLTLGSSLELGGGLLAIDPTSQLFAHAGAAIAGGVENAGRIDVGVNRLAIGGHYAGRDGGLQLTVSPGTLSAGGLDIQGDVTGNTQITFAGDGSEFTQGGKASILIVSSPNDDLATAGGFVAEDMVRLNGSLLPWSFGQRQDKNWYLSAESGVLPEVPGYGVLPSLAVLAAQNSDHLVHQRLAGVRDGELPQCGTQPEWPVERAGSGVIDDCRGFWVSTTGSELELGANPGFEVSGDDVGLYLGVDSAFDRQGRTLRGGFYLGYRQGNYWTTGVNSTDLPGSGQAKVGTDTLLAGMYMSHTWDTGRYVDMVLTGQLTDAEVRTEDGFRESLTGNALTFSTRVGQRYRLNGGWALEPQLQLAASAVSWDNLIDESGKQVMFDDNLVGTARAALRVEKTIARDQGSVIRPWATLGVQKVVGEAEEGVSLMTPGTTADAQAFPNHQLGTSATLEVGVEATLNQRLSLFGMLSIGRELDGTDYEQRTAYLGMRARW